MAEMKETEFLKPIDKANYRLVSELSGCNESKRIGSLESEKPQRLIALTVEKGSMIHCKTGRLDESLWRGDSDSMIIRMSQATGEALLAPLRNQWRKVNPITRDTGKRVEGKRDSDESIVVRS